MRHRCQLHSQPHIPPLLSRFKVVILIFWGLGHSQVPTRYRNPMGGAPLGLDVRGYLSLKDEKNITTMVQMTESWFHHPRTAPDWGYTPVTHRHDQMAKTEAPKTQFSCCNSIPQYHVLQFAYPQTFMKLAFLCMRLRDQSYADGSNYANTVAVQFSH